MLSVQLICFRSLFRRIDIQSVLYKSDCTKVIVITNAIHNVITCTVILFYYIVLHMIKLNICDSFFFSKDYLGYFKDD